MDNKIAMSAYKTIVRISVMHLPTKLSYKIFTLKKALQPHYQFYCEEEKKIAEKNNGKQNEQGAWSFTKEDFEHVAAEIKELNDLCIDINFDPFDAFIDDIEECNLSPAEFESLSPFIHFVEGSIEKR